ncbi:MFS transporter [Pigmentiphaga sp.]|uniref:MFS transporter n=1 Tax=Pigmentiphaga sp. TaxID=1977564 RepID=UPI00128C9AC7|nr:MFS transporter [Pigmentiphaga sp.]MPS25647.1 MFS transporter [Alcaligenaceae bacterium SAGV5]MPS54284.1 MFS transporter [Alcaligenaceae bacterium SAGV3]MPT60179.1 MFS transporter [Alcaligenaceae bacterium]
MNALTEKDVRRNALVLSCAQSLGGANPSIVISLGGLVGQMLATDKSLATLPVSLYNLGLALGTIPAAILMRRLGRRAAYMLGAVIGGVAGLLAAYSITAGVFALFCVATAIAGTYGSCVQSYRFGATDGADGAFKARAISWVMVGGLVGAVIGPQTVIWTRDAIAGIPFAGSFVGQAVLALAALPVLILLRGSVRPAAEQGGGRPLREIAASGRFVVAVVAGVVSYGMMSFVMTAAPIAMVACGHTVGEAALGIQWHVLAMYGPSFVTGRLITRFGKEWVTMAGLLLMAVSGAIALHGLSVGHFWLSLVFLGAGWNLGFIGATAMVTDCYRPEERTKVQALNDFLVFGSVAVASFSSGRLLNASGWETINWLLYPAVAIVLVPLLWQAGRTRRAVA